MPTGTLSNLEHSGFVRTPPVWAERIVRNLLAFGTTARVLDPTAGEGDLLAPLAHMAGVDLYGVEISRARAEVARQRLPRGTLVVTTSLPRGTLVVSAIEAVRITPASMDLLLANPPYFFEDGRRAEYRIIADAGVALRPGGILVAILPARSAWDGVMINHWCKHYERVRCWKFPDGDPEHDEGAFQRFTQIVVVGVRRATPLKTPETLEQQRLAGWRWRQPKKAESPWAQRTPPPVLPEQPIADPYLVPEAGLVLPALLTKSADETTLLEALARSGVQQSPDWASATTWQPERQAEQPIMPPTGEAHLAAEILTGLLDGEALTGPDGQPYVFVTCITQEAHQVALDAEDLERERQKGVVQVEVKQIDDHPVLGVLNLTTGDVAYHQGEAVFTYLTPWLGRLASRVMEGLNLQDVIDVIAWYELALNLFHLDQASRRHWRLGRTAPAEIVYLAYAGSAAHRKLAKLARESGAAAAFAGEPAKGALIEQVGADQTMLARLSASLEALAEEEDLTVALAGQADLQAAFARRAEDLTATLKQGRHWLGLVDTLPERLAAFHAARLTRTERIEVAPSAAPAVTPPPQWVAPPAPAQQGTLVRRSLWEQEEAAADDNDAAEDAPPPVLSSEEVAPMPVQGSITATASSLVLTFAAKGAHLETIRQLSRTYGGHFAWSGGAWVLPLLSFRAPVHVVDAVLDAFPTLQGVEDARLTALETLLRHLAARYRVVTGREPNEAAMQEQVKTCTEAQQWLRALEQQRAKHRSS